MIALDTSSMIAFLSGKRGNDAEAVGVAFRLHQAVFPPVVVTELLSDPTLQERVALLIRSVPALEIRAGYWERAGKLRAMLLGRGLRARLADTLIAQSCLDHDVPLVTRDGDFRHFARHAGLRLQ